MTFGRPKCRCNKAVFKDLAHAERVLARKEALGQDSNMPTRAEQCDQRQWHLVGAKVLSTGPDRNTRDLVIVRDEGRCACCGTVAVKGDHNLQHRCARGAGGTSDLAINSPANLVILCGSPITKCHGRAESRADEMREWGFWLHRVEDPLRVPVRHAVHGWVLLDLAGGWSPSPVTGGVR